MIITSREQINNKSILVLTSLGGAPFHVGHINLLKECKPAALKYVSENYTEQPNIDNIKLLVLINSDEFLIKKHGFAFQSEDERAYIIDAIRDVDYTFIYSSEKTTIDDAIHYFQPHFMCKGGDRSAPEFMPQCELNAADDVGCVVLYGIGGTDKVNSSSQIIAKAVEHYHTELCREFEIVLADVPYRPRIANMFGY